MGKPEVGLSMLYCLGKPFERMAEYLPKANTNCIEIVDDGSHALNKQRLSTLKDVGSSYRLRYSVHAPFSDINIASPSEPLLKAMLKRLETSIACAKALEAYMWIFHPGMKTGISMFYPNMDWVQNSKTANTLAKLAEDYGVRIAIENVPEPYPFLMKSVEDFKQFFGEVDEDVGLVLDVGHANINGQIESFMRTFGKKIVHMHLSDNNGQSDQHLGIGFGTICWKEVASLMKEISYDKSAIIESIEHVDESVQKLKQLLI